MSEEIKAFLNDEMYVLVYRDNYDRASAVNQQLIDYIKELQKENKQLKERIAYLERSNNRREDTILEQRQEISDLEDNWNKLKEFIDTLWLDNKGIVTKIKDKIELIEQGDSNVKEKED